MNHKDYPSLYKAADTASKYCQSSYMRLMKTDLALIIVGALSSVYNFQSGTPQSGMYILSGTVLLAATILTFVVKIQKYEDSWYQSRALAESAKTLTWRYATCSENFENTLPQNIVDTKFIQSIDELSTKFSDLIRRMDPRILSEPIITDVMKKIRRLTFTERKDYYIQQRIKEQKNWYAYKATANGWWENLWFCGIICSQFLAIGASGYLILNPDSNWNLVGLLTTVSAAGFAWLQLKQHQELKQAYTTATQELNSIEYLGVNVNSEGDFVKYVLDSENAISREHTLWVVQRRK